MRAIIRCCVCLLLGLAFIANSLPCGPGYITPLFDTTSAPEDPYTDFAAGRLGIVKPTFHRSVLFAAYRYIAGNGLTGDEQKAVIDVWNAEINNKGFADEPIDETVKAWVAKRAEIMGKEEDPPEIYAERSYGGYDFFPNCTKNAFETATETLTDRASAHGPNDPNVRAWVKSQDDVFENCSQGKQTPPALPTGAPEWLQKDHAYQVAAAEFYAMDYETAKKHFAEIASDVDSPWQQTADYLVLRTLIRQASLTKAQEKANKYYEEAEARLQRFSGGKFSASAERLEGLVKYRLHPKQRVSELAKKLAFTGGSENFRQELIDYTWLLDKFESEILTAEQKRKEAEEAKKHPANSNLSLPPPGTSTETPQSNTGVKKNEDDLEINLYAENQTYTVYVAADASDADAIAAMEKIVGKPLTDDQRSSVKATRQAAYAGRFTNAQKAEYEGGYWGEEKMTRSLLPAYLQQDPLTDWLYTYQMKGADAYLYALKEFKESGSELWLMTALTKADKSSTDLARLLEAANNASRTSPAYTTIAYHAARILLSLGKTAEAKKLVEDMLNGDQLPISAQNSFVALRLQLAASMDDFLRDSLRKPYAFDWDGQTATIDQIIAEEKSYYDPENADGKTKEQYDAEIEENYKDKREWQSRSTFDDDTMDVFNQHFPTAKLIEVEQSQVLPDYLRGRFAMVIWMRAYLLDDMATLVKVNAELARLHPELQDDLAKVAASKTQAALDHSVLFLILKHPELTPYLEGGIGREDDEQDEWSGDDWWCTPYETVYNEETDSEQPAPLPARPKFLTPAQSQLAQNEHKRLKAIGDAPKFLGNKVLEWAKAFPTDKRVPEALYIVIKANGWTKYGCGNDEDLQKELETYLKKHYPSSPFIKKLAEDQEGNQ
ncbi:MAG: hypothetical protein JO053_09660 [Acidobacteria bacterium]|nr:hypothetical protein [Acidobacteriota bacterium]